MEKKQGVGEINGVRRMRRGDLDGSSVGGRGRDVVRFVTGGGVGVCRLPVVDGGVIREGGWFSL